MTDSFNSFTVILENEIREDDAKVIINAIKQLRGVIDVTGTVASMDSRIAEAKAKHEIYCKIYDILKY